MADKVINPPAGGPQEFASTNDENQNPVLKDKPYVVVARDADSIGVVNRHADEASAKAEAEARTKASRDAGNRTTFTVVKENDPENGLPSLLAEVETAAFGPVDEESATESKTAAKASK